MKVGKQAMQFSFKQTKKNGKGNQKYSGFLLLGYHYTMVLAMYMAVVSAAYMAMVSAAIPMVVQRASVNWTDADWPAELGTRIPSRNCTMFYFPSLTRFQQSSPLE